MQSLGLVKFLASPYRASINQRVSLPGSLSESLDMSFVSSSDGRSGAVEALEPRRLGALVPLRGELCKWGSVEACLGSLLSH